MGSSRAMAGRIEKGGAIELLRDIEAKRITGKLKFNSKNGVSGEIALIGGQIAVDQPKSEDGRDPVDVLLGLEKVTYEIKQHLPDLAVSRGTELEKHGSLAVHVPVDLMNYCETAGLTGVLELSHEGRKAEIFYECGELTAIELDGNAIDDLKEVFGWEQGRFRIRLDLKVGERLGAIPDEIGDFEIGEPSSYSQKGENTARFLSVVELALSEVMSHGERARSPTRTSPPLPPPARARPRPESIPPPPLRKRADQTVRLVYLTGDPTAPGAEPASTRHAQRGGAEIPHLEAMPERLPELSLDDVSFDGSEESDDMAKKRKKSRPAPAAKTPTKRSEPAPEAKAAAPRDPAPARTPAARPDAKEATVRIRTQPAPIGDVVKSMGAAAGWALAVIGLAVGILVLLAHLPPVD
ncbi:MAG: DUF4388 domain-containing protein [Sandaracinaceae bacterium]